MRLMKIPKNMQRIGKASLLVMAATLTIGATPVSGTSPKFVASASLLPTSTLNQAPVAPLVQERVKTAPSPVEASKPVAATSAAPGGGNGYVMAGNNCVACVRAMTGRGQNGNAGTWRASSSTPSIGAIMIWRPGQGGASSAGHVGVVKGINADGTVNIAHCNWPGQTRFQSTGLFW